MRRGSGGVLLASDGAWSSGVRRVLGAYRRVFSTIQRGHDKQVESLFVRLGFGKDKEPVQARRTLAELEQGFVRQVELLRDPVNDPADVARLEELKEAYLLLRNDTFRRNYAAHYANSNDARLHVLVDGGAVADNFNPEHQSFEYVDHALLHGGSGHAERASGASPSPASTEAAYRSATGQSSPCASAATTAPRAPQRGADLPFLLKLRFEEGLLGCHRTLRVSRHRACPACEGAGTDRGRGSQPRRCPQCLGRGSVHLPSATYHVERACAHCGGAGTVPAPLCRRCRGRGLLLDQPQTVTVTVPAGSFTGTVFRLAGKGHDGVRGGHAGDLVINTLTAEHRYFHRVGDALHAMLPLPLSTALLGGVVRVPTVHTAGGHGVGSPAMTSLRVPPCVGNGSTLRLREHEVRPDSAGVGQGGAEEVDVYFHVLLLIPRAEDLSGRQRSALAAYDGTVERGAAEEVQGPAAEEARRAQCAQLKAQYRSWLTE